MTTRNMRCLTSHTATRSGGQQVVNKPDQPRRQIHLEPPHRTPKRYARNAAPGSSLNQIYLVGSGADRHPPGFVYGIFFSLFVLSTASPSTSGCNTTAGAVEGLPRRRTGIRHLVPHRQEPCSRGRSSPPPSHRVQRTKRSRVLGSGTLPGKIRDLATTLTSVGK